MLFEMFGILVPDAKEKILGVICMVDVDNLLLTVLCIVVWF